MTAQLAATARQRAEPSMRLRLDRNPLRLAFSASPWRAAGYLLTYLAVSWVTFSVALTAVTTAVALAVTVLALPLLVVVAQVVHWCAAVERLMLRQVAGDQVRADYLQSDGRGSWAHAKAAWRDRATWRELGYLIGLWAPLYALDTIVVSIWLTFLAGITLPLWYWAPRGTEMVGYVHGAQVHGVAIGYFPHSPSGSGAIGLYVDSLPRALLAAAIFAVLFLMFNYALVATARMHARVARVLLRPPADPLEEARGVLNRPGPLGPLRAADH
jgi:Putative sensor